jgi:hypothetical protein
MFRLDRLERFALSKVFPLIPSQATSWLFGSCTDIDGHGGDIDILIQHDASPQERFDLSHRLTVAFQEHCDEKIEFVAVQEIQSFPATIETYVGESGRSSRLLLMQPTGPGTYPRALKKRGPGVHHFGVVVPSMKTFLNQLEIS